jgi:hypothetical protein
MQVIQSVVEQEDGMLLIGLDRDDHLTLCLVLDRQA